MGTELCETPGRVRVSQGFGLGLCETQRDQEPHLVPLLSRDCLG